ncbi:hypothetical protein PIB30_015354 [Stylosanthes scabra]|uniref:DUF4220 domain-containing protein n=1 Tax=Stylosanthes scabra TaxID=79078 RepID=A0ABU6R7A7_9FABA|nr:hypothetical protein [Stylosanthes scabra]
MNISIIPGQLQDLWDLWGLEVLMLLSFTMQVILTVFGSRRKDIPGMWIRFTVWFTYLLSSSLTKIIIGKLTVIPGSDPGERNIRRELKAMFAPLLLVQIGNPDAITAYSIEDNRLGLRQLLSLVLQVAVVIWIVVKSWTHSKLSYLYLPLFVSGLIKGAFPHHWKASFIEAMLAGAVLMEIYQIAQLPFTDWAIIQIIKHQNLPLMIPFLRILGPQASNRKRWSNTLAQFNLLSFCLHDKPLKCRKILKFRGLGMGLKKNKSRTRIPFPQELKVLMVEEMRGIDRERGLKPFNQRGEWSLGRYGCLSEFKWSVKRDFDKSITIWHIATDICYYSDSQTNNAANPKTQMAKLLSNYMMYLLALRPHMLSMTTAKIIFQHAFDKLKALLSQKEEPIKDEKDLCKILRMEWLPQYSISERKSETVVTSKWHMLRDAQRLARNLMLKENKWQIICSVWVEMLCYAAANCSIDYHSEQIRRGGGLITHIWIMLAHKTDKYHISD